MPVFNRLRGAPVSFNRSVSSRGGFGRFRHIVWPFAVAETIVWASFYYSFPALLPEWERSLGWSRTELSTAFSAALVVSAVLAPSVGHLIDRGLSRFVFTGSAILGAVMLVLLSQVSELWQFFAVWIGIGVAMSGALYEACFAIVTRSMGINSKRAITLITLVAGFAGTVSFPAAHAFVGLIGWRGAVMVFAAAVLVLAAPLLWYGCYHAERHFQDSAEQHDDNPARVRQVLRSPTFWLLAISFTAIAVEHGGIITHMLLILEDRGVHQEAAVLAASMIGPMQVTGRLAMMAAERYVSVVGITVGCFMAMAGAAICLLFAGGSVGLIASFVILHGAGYGVTSIVRPVITAEFLGRQGFGVISGMIALPFMFGYAAAPTLAALGWEIGGYDLVIGSAIVLPVFGLLTFLVAKRTSTRMEFRDER